MLYAAETMIGCIAAITDILCFQRGSAVIYRQSRARKPLRYRQGALVGVSMGRWCAVLFVRRVEGYPDVRSESPSDERGKPSAIILSFF